MQDSKVSSAAVISWILWAAVITAMGAAWIVWIVGFWHAAVMLGLLGCATSAAAATAHIRRYSIRVCALIRRLYDMDGRQPADRSETLRRVP